MLELNVPYWIDADGRETSKDYKLQDNLGEFQILFFYQAACPGCHITGFPTLQKLSIELEGKAIFYVVQTAFENFEENTKDTLLDTKNEYNLKIPFGYDSGLDRPYGTPITMETFKTKGTPWFVIIDREGKEIFADFRVEADTLIKYVREN